MVSIRGKKAIVTGGAMGIGLATAFWGFTESMRFEVTEDNKNIYQGLPA